jgi:ribulose-phosphate 3-epimerase
MNPRIAPSLLACDYARFGEEALRAAAAGGDLLHLDIMDGHFVPNISFGPEMVRTVRRVVPGALLDVHLMIQQPDRYANEFIKAGADILTVHLEASHDVGRTLQMIRDKGCRVGLALNPPTLLKNALPFLPHVDLLLCMTVNPGFGGQRFIDEVLQKITAAREYIRDQGLKVDIEVDGGINEETGARCVAAGADILVAGTSLFKQPDMAAAIRSMRQKSLAVVSAG